MIGMAGVKLTPEGSHGLGCRARGRWPLFASIQCPAPEGWKARVRMIADDAYIFASSRARRAGLPLCVQGCSSVGWSLLPESMGG